LALEVMARHDVSLFCLSLDMPDMCGTTLAAKIKNEPQYAQTPIVFLTAHADRETIFRALSLGVTDYVVKPPNLLRLLVKTRKWLD
ncbi:MAG: response regulator, partial [Oscillospiraceae bacterium]|nr:response regulator [Oscillospiraceae bacterium]